MPPTEKLKPLAVDPTGKLQPASPVREPIAVAPEPVEKADSVADWVAEHPEDKPFKEDAPAVAAPSSDPVVDAKKPEPKPAAPAYHKPSEPTPPTAPKPGEVAPAKTEPAPKIEPAAPAAKTYEPQERIALAEGSEWTREQIVAGLTERAKLQADLKTYEPIKAEAEGYAQTFGMTASEAKTAWGPILSRLAQEPQTADFLDSYLQNPALAEYLNECAVHFQTQAPQAARQPQRQPQKPAVDPVMQQQLRELQTWKNEQEKRSSDDRVRSEWAQATSRYPFLAHDQAAKQDLLATAQWMWSQDNSKGILDALALKAPVYDRIGQLNAPAAEPKPQPVVPQLLGSPGASPTATRTHNNRPRKFGVDDDPVKDWLENTPAQFAG